MTKIVVTALVAAIMVICLALAARSQESRIPIPSLGGGLVTGLLPLMVLGAFGFGLTGRLGDAPP